MSIAMIISVMPALVTGALFFGCAKTEVIIFFGVSYASLFLLPRLLFSCPDFFSIG